MKENLKPYVYKHTKRVKARCGTFCRTVRRVVVCSEGSNSVAAVRKPLFAAVAAIERASIRATLEI